MVNKVVIATIALALVISDFIFVRSYTVSNMQPTLNLSDLYNKIRNGGLTVNQVGSAAPAGPGYGYYGTQDVYRPGQVLGATSSAGGNPTPTSNALPAVSNPADQAKSELDIIREKLGAFRSQAEAEAQNARQRFADYTTNAKARFQTLRDKLAQTVSSGLANLGQERTNVQNLYGRAGGDIRSTLESVLRGNRQQARAQGFGDSSFYQDLQGGTRQKFGNQMADLFTEQANKEAGIGTREGEVKNYGLTEGQSINSDETALVNDAQSKLNEELQSADQLVRSGVIDSQSALDQVMTNYGSRLDAIRQYISDKDLQTQTLAAQGLAKYGGFQTIEPGLQKILSDTSALDAAKGLAGSIPSLANVPGTTGSALGFMGNTDVNTKRLQDLGLLIG